MQEQFLNDIFLPDSDIEKEIDDYCAMLKAPDTDFATFYLAHGGGMMPPGLSDAIHACIARHRARLFFGLLAIRNVAILVPVSYTHLYRSILYPVAVSDAFFTRTVYGSVHCSLISA